MECDLKDITVHYEAFGEGRPLVVLHGWGMDHRYMVSDVEPLFGQRDGWRRIYRDLPGHGLTPGPDWIANRDQELDIVLDLIDALVPGERFALAGSSAGAYLAPREVVEYLRATVPSAETGDEAYQERIQGGPGTHGFSFDVDALPQPCPVPTLIVTGRQDSVIGYRDAWGILENYPRGTFAVLDRCGHFMGIEQADLFHALAGEWLDRVEEYVGA